MGDGMGFTVPLKKKSPYSLIATTFSIKHFFVYANILIEIKFKEYLEKRKTLPIILPHSLVCPQILIHKAVTTVSSQLRMFLFPLISSRAHFCIST